VRGRGGLEETTRWLLWSHLASRGETLQTRSARIILLSCLHCCTGIEVGGEGAQSRERAAEQMPLALNGSTIAVPAAQSISGPWPTSLPPTCLYALIFCSACPALLPPLPVWLCSLLCLPALLEPKIWRQLCSLLWQRSLLQPCCSLQPVQGRLQLAGLQLPLHSLLPLQPWVSAAK
jgi:hypothetical protein